MKKIVIFSILTVLMFVPSLALAQGTIGIPCSGADCGFPQFMQLISNVLRFLTLLSIPLATIAFAYAGWELITSNGNEGKMERAKEIFTKVVIGFVIVLAAWLIVRTITSALLDPGAYYNFLGLVARRFV